MNVNSVIDYCLGLDFYKLQDFAGENYKKAYNYISSKYGGEKVNTLLIGLIFTCVASDGKFSDGEWEFIAHFVGGYSYDEAYKVASEFYNDEAQNITKELLEIFSAELQDAFLSVCIAVLTVDKRLGDAEINYLKHILGY